MDNFPGNIVNFSNYTPGLRQTGKTKFLNF